MQILLLNGPNLNLLGVREPEVYGKETFTDYFRQLKNKYPSVDISCFQSNVEGERWSRYIFPIQPGGRLSGMFLI